MRLLICFCLVSLASCSLNNAEEDRSIEKYFKEKQMTGSFALFDNITGKFTVYNMARYRDSAVNPFSTYNIITALIGLETGRIKDSAHLYQADSIPYTMGKDTITRWLDTLGYNPARITPDEQLGLVKKLYFSQLPFQPRSQRIVKGWLKKEENANYQLSYITGEGRMGNRNIAWLSGWIEENNHPYFFVIQAERPSGYALTAENVGILKAILAQYGFMQGRK